MLSHGKYDAAQHRFELSELKTACAPPIIQCTTIPIKHIKLLYIVGTNAFGTLLDKRHNDAGALVLVVSVVGGVYCLCKNQHNVHIGYHPSAPLFPLGAPGWKWCWFYYYNCDIVSSVQLDAKKEPPCGNYRVHFQIIRL